MPRYGLKLLPCLLTALLIPFTFTPAGAQTAQTEDPVEENPLAEQLRSVTQSEVFNLGVLIHGGGHYSYYDNSFNGGRTFETQNAILSLTGNLDHDFDYIIRFNATWAPPLLDASIGYTPHTMFQWRVGAQKPLAAGDILPSPAETDFISRARVIGALFQAREIGVSLSGSGEAIDYYLGVYNGTGLTLNSDNNFLYTGRFSYTIRTAEEGSLRLAVNAAYGESFNTTSGSNGLLMNGERLIYGADLRYEDENWLLAAEWLTGELDVRAYPTNWETITGTYITAGHWLSEENIVMARWDRLGYSEIDTSSDLLTAAFRRQMSELVRFQFELHTQLESGVDAQFGASARFQLDF